MNRRERYVVAGGVILVCLAVIYQAGIVPVLEKRALLLRRAEARAEMMAQVVQLDAEYHRLEDRIRTSDRVYARREPGFTLFAFLETAAVNAGVDGHIDSMKPSSVIDRVSRSELSMVEMTLKQISLAQLLAYLYRVETSDNVVFVKRMAITVERRERPVINAVLQVETVKSPGEGEL
jgi:general secretion pathway protein M